jgi:hypothetical protein
MEQAVRSTPSSDSEVGSGESVGVGEGTDLLLECWLGNTSWVDSGLSGGGLQLELEPQKLKVGRGTVKYSLDIRVRYSLIFKSQKGSTEALNFPIVTS